METQSIESLNCAKKHMLDIALRKSSRHIWLSTKLICNALYPSSETRFRLMFSRISHDVKSRIQRMSLKCIDKKHKLHYVNIKFPYDFFHDCEMHKHRPIHNSTCYSVDTLPSKWFAYIFDELCKMSDQGMELILMPRSIHNRQHIEPITLMKPYKGSQLQVEADLKSPDYAYLDDTPQF